MRRTLPAIGRASQPWLGGVGLSVVSMLFVFSVIAIAPYTVQHDAMNFIASRAQFAWSATCLIVLVTAAFFPPKPELSKSAGEAPSPWFAGIVALLACSLFVTFPLNLPQLGNYGTNSLAEASDAATGGPLLARKRRLVLLFVSSRMLGLAAAMERSISSTAIWLVELLRHVL